MVSKGKVFVMCFWAIIYIFSSMLIVGFLSGDYSLVPVAACLTAIGSLAALYIAGQVTNNGVKGRNWCQQMYDSENPREDKKEGK